MQARQVVLAAALFGSALITAAVATGAQQSQGSSRPTLCIHLRK